MRNRQLAFPEGRKVLSGHSTTILGDSAEKPELRAISEAVDDRASKI